jgi:hypothetical protein
LTSREPVLPKFHQLQLPTPYGRGAGVGRGLAVGWNLGVGVTRGVALGVPVTVAVGVGEIVAVNVGVGLTVAVAVAVDVGVAVGVTSDMKGATTATVTGEPVLKKPMVALLAIGGALESNRKLYNVPQRIALAFGFCANVSELQVRVEPVPPSTVHGVLLYPASPTVPSLAQPGSCGGA